MKVSVTRFKAYGDYLIGIAHHGNEHVDENNDHNGAVDAKHEQTNKHCKGMLPIERVEAIFFDKTERSPE